MSSKIPVRRTGLVVFSSRMFSVVTGLIFLLLMTRSLSTAEFGLWEVILDIVTFACYPAGILVFWATRDIARGRLLGKTAIWLNLAFSAFGFGLYAVFSFASAARVSAGWETLTLAVLLVPIGYWNQAANAVVSGHNPIVAGYSVISSEACKLAVAVPALLILHAGISGVILSVIVANLAQAGTSTFLTRDADILPFDRAAARSWISRWWLPSLTALPYVVGVADTYVASLTSGGTALVGDYQAAFAVATISGYSFYLASALYPLLLRGGSDELTSSTLDLTLIFGVPMAVGAAALAKPILFVLKPTYTLASTGLTILAFSALVYSISLIIDQNLMGRDKVDVDEKATFTHYRRSSIFFVSVIDLATAVAYLVSIYAVVAIGTADGWAPATIIELWAIAQLVVFSAFAAIKANRARRTNKLIAARSLLDYIVGSALMGGFLVLASRFLDYGVSTYYFGFEVLALGLVGVAIYMTYVLATEPSARHLVSAVLAPLRGRSEPSSG